MIIRLTFVCILWQSAFHISCLIIKIILQEFLSLGELQESGNLEKSGLRPKKEDRKVVLQDVTASWDKVRQDLDWILIPFMLW